MKQASYTTHGISHSSPTRVSKTLAGGRARFPSPSSRGWRISLTCQSATARHSCMQKMAHPGPCPGELGAVRRVLKSEKESPTNANPPKGKSAEATCAMQGPSASPRHAMQLLWSGGRHMLQDLFVITSASACLAFGLPQGQALRSTRNRSGVPRSQQTRCSPTHA